MQASAPGDTLFVYANADPSAVEGGNFTLKVGQKLIGQAAGLTQARSIAPGPRPVLAGTVTLVGDNTVAGFSLSGIRGDGTVNAVVENNVLASVTDTAISLRGARGAVRVSGNLVSARSGSIVDTALALASPLDDSATSTSTTRVNQTTYEVADNQIDATGFTHAIGLRVDETVLNTDVTSVTISGNAIDNSESESITTGLRRSSADVTISGNHLNRCNRGILVLSTRTEDARLVVRDNVVSVNVYSRPYIENDPTFENTALQMVYQPSDTLVTGNAFRAVQVPNRAADPAQDPFTTDLNDSQAIRVDGEGRGLLLITANECRQFLFGIDVNVSDFIPAPHPAGGTRVESNIVGIKNLPSTAGIYVRVDSANGTHNVAVRDNHGDQQSPVVGTFLLGADYAATLNAIVTGNTFAFAAIGNATEDHKPFTVYRFGNTDVQSPNFGDGFISLNTFTTSPPIRNRVGPILSSETNPTGL